ncbi:hypothetical protein C8A03DRAFT_31775 [Achaetomium macrosporum]|uniref:SH3 domain-containing protein n=1 Tax=Achaetomium macrosporum TaxID=79813 RepID=A0AAN7CDM1_9PEZI|nr:hypothetical protein C8A03DRAFT_31775 [Achaetomium macrosporum]
MVSEDRQRVIETNRSLRLIKNELESLLEKGIITDSAFDSISAMLPAETPLSGAAAARRTNPTPAPATPASITNNPSPSPAPAPAPPSYAQSTASPPSLPARNPPPAAVPDKPVLVHARALYAYKASDARDCSFEREDRIAVHEYMNADWWMGRNLRTGEEGIFPRSYVVVDHTGDEKQQQQPAPAQPYYPVAPVPVSGYPAPPPAGQVGQWQGQEQQQHEGGNSKLGEHGKKFGKKLGNAAIFGAGATIGSNIVNSIF